MVRTKAETRAVVAKTSRPKNASTANSFNDGEGTGKGRERAGGNLYCPRNTPGWQKPITSFFVQPNETGENSDSRKDGMEIEKQGSTTNCSTSISGKTSTG